MVTNDSQLHSGTQAPSNLVSIDVASSWREHFCLVSKRLPTAFSGILKSEKKRGKDREAERAVEEVGEEDQLSRVALQRLLTWPAARGERREGVCRFLDYVNRYRVEASIKRCL